MRAVHAAAPASTAPASLRARGRDDARAASPRAPLPRGRRVGAARASVRAMAHPSRSRKLTRSIEAAKEARAGRLDVATKLVMWGVDVERMRAGERSRDDDDDDDARGGGSGGAVREREETTTARPRPDDETSSSSDASAATSDAPPSDAAKRVAELLRRQREEAWPMQGTDAWHVARARLVSASEASSALGVDPHRGPERLIRDKLRRLNEHERVPSDVVEAMEAEANGGWGKGEARARARANDLGWRANGGKGRRGKKKKKRGGGGGAGGKRRAAAAAAAVADGARGVPGAPRALPPAIVHGNAFEPVARAHYARVERETVHEFGLKTHDRLPWLAATPDGVAAASGAVLEIKCPYSRPVLPRTRLREHYPQLQVLMRVFDLDECHFVQFKPPGVGVGRAGVMNEDRPLYLRETVRRDDGWWDANEPRLRAFHDELERALARREEAIARLGGGGGGGGGGGESGEMIAGEVIDSQPI